MHGEGKLTWEDGKSYVGMFDQDLRHGHGKFIWSDGRSYEGNWEYGK